MPNMTPAKAPPKIFDEELLVLRRARAEKRAESFLMDRCMADLVDRLQDINRSFENVLIYGPKTLEADIRSQLPEEKIGKLVFCETLESLPPETHFDLVVSLLRLQSLNDLPGGIIQLAQRLKADGLFIAAMFGGETLSELRQVFYTVDEKHLGGLSAHIYPMANYTQAAGLLSRAGLNQPVIDTDRFTVSYSSFDKLISDLRDMGETNVLTARRKTPHTRQYKAELEAAYKRMFSRGDGKLQCSYEVLWLTGWKPHESQQKPLKPGSAKMSLKEGLAQAVKEKS